MLWTDDDIKAELQRLSERVDGLRLRRLLVEGKNVIAELAIDAQIREVELEIASIQGRFA